MLNKRSQLEDLLPLLLLIVILVFLLMFGFITEQTRAKRTAADVNFQSLSKDSTQLLINFLKSPLNDNSNIADAINNYFLTEDEILKEQISKQALEFFSVNYLETDYSTWSLEIKNPEKEELIIGTERSKRDIISRKVISKIMIPTYDPNELIGLRLFFIQKKFISK